MQDKKTSIVGIGVDIEEIARFEKLPLLKNKSFYERIFSPGELSYCFKMASPYQHLAVRFCAKEAVVKALAASSVSYRGIEVTKKFNKPAIKVRGCENLQIHVSLSHARGYAIALIVIEKPYERA